MPPRSLKYQTPPTKEIRFIATYEDGRDIRRQDVVATSRDEAYKLAINRTPHTFRLFNLRQKKDAK